VPPDLLEEVFELNMQLEELRANKKMGDSDPDLVGEVEKEKTNLEAKHEALLGELKQHWNEWDSFVDRARAGTPASPDERAQITDKMVDVLNRRNYIRNLLRDVAAVLES